MWGSEGTGDYQFIEPTFVTVDSQDNLYVVDMGAKKIKVFALSSSSSSKWLIIQGNTIINFLY